MSDKASFRLSTKNKVLTALPSAEYDFLHSHFEKIHLSPGKLVYQAGDAIPYIFFPSNGMISLLSVTEQGQAVEVGFTGFEGLVGLPLLLGRNEIPYQALTQAPTDALRIESKFAVQLFNKCGAFHKIVLQYFHVVLKQLSQTCLCNHFHRIEARLCRWLTVMSERSGNTHLVLTQEFLAHMLGVQRTSIGMIAASMQSAGIIRYSRGKVEIVNFERLKNSACECYRIVKEEHQKFIGSQNNFYMSDNRQTDEAVSFIM